MQSGPPPASPPVFQYHIIGADGREYGPVVFNVLHEWLAQGQMNGQSMVRRAHEANWQPVMTLPELQPMLAGSGIPLGQPEDNPTARKLVTASHILGYGGLVVLIFGPVVGWGLGSGILSGIAATSGILMAVIGAIIGQVGRGMQGRAI